MKCTYFLLSFLCASLTFAAVSAPILPEKEYPEIAQRVVSQLGSSHLSGERFDDRLSAIAWTNLVDTLDFDHTLLTRQDLAKLEPKKTQLDDMIKARDLSFGYDLMLCIRERLGERNAYVQKILKEKKPFDFTKDDSYVWKRRKAERPADSAEQKALWRAALKNEYLTLTLAKELDAEEAQAEKANPKKDADEKAKKDKKKASFSDDDLNEPVPVILSKRYRTLADAFNEIDSESILQRYLSAIANAYDPHTDYMSPMNFEDFNMEMNLTLCGIGATLRVDDGTVRIMEIMPGSPAERDTRDIRLCEGDRIIGVAQGDGPMEDIRHKALNRTVRKIRGKKGSTVVLKVIPFSDKSGTRTKLVDLVRDEIALEEQAVTGRVERVQAADGTERRFGYVRIPTFYAGNAGNIFSTDARSMSKDLLAYLRTFNSSHVDGLVVDLRNNGGGSLLEALTMNGYFVSGPVVQVKNAESVQVLPSPVTVAFRKPMVVLINRTSASASEIVAGALQDYGRAIIIGDSKTHGKGTVQTVQTLGGDTKVYGANRITTACFYRVNGGTTQLRGVEPDLVLSSIYDALEIGEDQLPCALPYTTIEPAYYARTSDLSAFLPKLKKASDARLSKDTQYQKSAKIIDYVRQANAEQTVSLQMDQRRERMRAERAMQKLEEEEMTPMRYRKNNVTMDSDPVLRESFNVLSDYIDLRGGPDEPVNTDGDLGSRCFRIFGQVPASTR
ncbi:MAG: carboxy terminal-processing peptidase [Kiritimatiellia bacterium]